MNPRRGGRVFCDLVASDATGARYEVALSTPTRAWRGRAEVRLAGPEVIFSGFAPGPEAPDPWLLEYAEAFLRAEARQRARRPGTPWAACVARWRAGPDAR